MYLKGSLDKSSYSISPYKDTAWWSITFSALYISYVTHFFCFRNFEPLNLPQVFLSSPHPSYLFCVYDCIYDSVSVLFWLWASTYKWNHIVFALLCLILLPLTTARTPSISLSGSFCWSISSSDPPFFSSTVTSNIESFRDRILVFRQDPFCRAQSSRVEQPQWWMPKLHRQRGEPEEARL